VRTQNLKLQFEVWPGHLLLSTGERAASQPKLSGFMNIKHLRMLSQQNAMVDHHLQQNTEATHQPLETMEENGSA
jgi:hypothetical protein